MGTPKRLGLGGVGVLASAAVVLLATGPASAGRAIIQPRVDTAQAAPNQVSGASKTNLPGYTQTNIVSDQPGQAALTDPNLVNAWGMSHGPNTPVWVSDNGTNKSTLYTGANGVAPPSIVGLVVSIPGGAPTGQVFNDTTGFDLPGTTTPARFMFASEDGDITVWNGGTAAVIAKHVDGAVYKGLGLAHSPFGPLLLAADFTGGVVDVFDSSFTKLDVPLLFHDPNLPKGYGPFNVTELGGKVYVTYAKIDPVTGDDVAGPGRGFVDVYTNYGALISRLVSHGALNSPWGLAIAPADFGRFSNDLLVGNFGNGRINVYDPTTGHFLGALSTSAGNPIVIDGLWALIVGDPAAGGTDSVWFSAGPDDEQHGLVGLLNAD